MPAALLMSSLQARVQVLFDDPTELAALVTRLNRIIVKNSPVNRFISFFIGVLDPHSDQITYVNAGTTGAEVHLPFGGMKQTGNGHREAGQAALDVFTEWKSIYVDYSGKLQRAQIDNVEHPAP